MPTLGAVGDGFLLSPGVRLLLKPVWPHTGVGVKIDLQQQLGPDWGLLGSGFCPEISQPPPHWCALVFWSQADIFLKAKGSGASRVFDTVLCLHSPGIPGLCCRGLLQHGQL